MVGNGRRFWVRNICYSFYFSFPLIAVRILCREAFRTENRESAHRKGKKSVNKRSCRRVLESGFLSSRFLIILSLRRMDLPSCRSGPFEHCTYTTCGCARWVAPADCGSEIPSQSRAVCMKCPHKGTFHLPPRQVRLEPLVMTFPLLTVP